jgi:sugar phosphate isomerase/epimerase
MLRLGGPIFLDSEAKAGGVAQSHGAVADDPVMLAKVHKAKGYTAAYAPNVKINETEKIRDIRKAFEAEDIMIAEVGYWENLLDLDPETRKKHRNEMLESLAVAEELGACCVVGLAGSYCHGIAPSAHKAENFSDEAFDEAVEMARYFIDEVKPKTTYLTYEVYQFGVVDTIANIEKLIKAVDRKQFGVHLDLTNFVNSPRTYWSSGDIMRECIKCFGDKIVAAHAKDVKMKDGSPSVILEEVLPGEGMLDIATCVRELDKLPQQIPYMMEHLNTEEEYDRAAAHIRNTAGNEGIII